MLNISGHRMGTAEIESALVAHHDVPQTWAARRSPTDMPVPPSSPLSTTDVFSEAEDVLSPFGASDEEAVHAPTFPVLFEPSRI